LFPSCSSTEGESQESQESLTSQEEPPEIPDSGKSNIIDEDTASNGSDNLSPYDWKPHVGAFEKRISKNVYKKSIFKVRLPQLHFTKYQSTFLQMYSILILFVTFTPGRQT
jgi:hypothetical protein